MTKLVSMKITKKERDEKNKLYENMPSSIGGDVYPYGLQIRLEDTALEKLGITSLPKTGRKVRVTCECTISSTREAASTHGGRDKKDRSMELQIEKIALDLEPTSAKEAIDDELAK